MSFIEPTCGRIVHYYSIALVPEDQKGILHFPAIVINDSASPNLSIFTNSFRNPVTLQLEVPHKSNFVEGQNGYWDWPEKKN